MNPLVSPLESFDVGDMFDACVQVVFQSLEPSLRSSLVVVGAVVAITLTIIRQSQQCNFGDEHLNPRIGCLEQWKFSRDTSVLSSTPACICKDSPEFDFTDLRKNALDEPRDRGRANTRERTRVRCQPRNSRETCTEHIIKLTVPFERIGSLRTESKDAVTSGRSRIAAAATVSHGRHNVETRWTAAAATAGHNDAATSCQNDTQEIEPD